MLGFRLGFGRRFRLGLCLRFRLGVGLGLRFRLGVGLRLGVRPRLGPGFRRLRRSLGFRLLALDQLLELLALLGLRLGSGGLGFRRLGGLGLGSFGLGRGIRLRLGLDRKSVV